MEELITVLRGIYIELSVFVILLVLLIAVIILKPMGGNGKNDSEDTR